jgi:hypothetical protein
VNVWGPAGREGIEIEAVPVAPILPTPIEGVQTILDQSVSTTGQWGGITAHTVNIHLNELTQDATLNAKSTTNDSPPNLVFTGGMIVPVAEQSQDVWSRDMGRFEKQWAAENGQVALVARFTNEARRRPRTDSVHMPARSRFVDAAHYYSTLFHELIHSTGHEIRLNRTFGDHFGDELYSKEELVAEMGAAFLCAMVGIANEHTDSTPRPTSRTGLASWRKTTASSSTQPPTPNAPQTASSEKPSRTEPKQNPPST